MAEIFNLYTFKRRKKLSYRSFQTLKPFHTKTIYLLLSISPRRTLYVHNIQLNSEKLSEFNLKKKHLILILTCGGYK